MSEQIQKVKRRRREAEDTPGSEPAVSDRTKRLLASSSKTIEKIDEMEGEHDEHA